MQLIRWRAGARSRKTGTVCRPYGALPRLLAFTHRFHGGLRYTAPDGALGRRKRLRQDAKGGPTRFWGPRDLVLVRECRSRWALKSTRCGAPRKSFVMRQSPGCRAKVPGATFKPRAAGAVFW